MIIHMDNGVVIEDHMAQWYETGEIGPQPWTAIIRCGATWQQTGEPCDHMYLSYGGEWPGPNGHQRVFGPPDSRTPPAP